MSTVANFLTVSGSLIHRKHRTHTQITAVVGEEKSYYTKRLDLDDKTFIEEMKANPQLWGKQKNQFGKNEFKMREGWIEIYSRDGVFSRSTYFQNHTVKMEQIREAFRSIRNLPGSYIHINYAE